MWVSQSLRRNLCLSCVPYLLRSRANVIFAEKTYHVQLNRLFVQVISSLTSSLRHDGALNVVVTKFLANLVPYPRTHIMRRSYAASSPRRRLTWYSANGKNIMSFFQPLSMLSSAYTCGCVGCAPLAVHTDVVVMMDNESHYSTQPGSPRPCSQDAEWCASL